MPGSLPGLERLIAVLKKYGIGVDPKLPSPRAPRAGNLVLSEPYDPLLAEVHARFGGGRFGDLLLLDVEGADESLESTNANLRRSWESLEPLLQRLFCFCKEWDFEYYFATVPSLAGADGVQPVVYLIGYEEMPIVPIASSVDRAFDLWARFSEFRLEVYGNLDSMDDLDHVFPWNQVARIAEDRELVRMLEERKFDELLAPDPETREWVDRVIAAARSPGRGPPNQS